MNFHRKPITFVSNVTIKVLDIERSISFYQRVIGFELLEKSTTTAALTADGKTSILTLEQPENVEPKKGRTTGLYHFAILLPTREDLANFVYHSIDVGLPLASSDHLVSEALYFSDPDGNGIEVYRDREPEGWSWQGDQVEMAVDPLDFEDLLKTGEKGGWQGLPQATVMGHIHLHVSQLDDTKYFYEEGLGFETVSQFGNQALFISTGKYHHHIGLNTWNGVGAPAPSENSVGLQSYTLTYPTKEAVQQTVKNLQTIGASVQEEGNQAVTQDPSGNKIIITY
ncbi:VOC family protein [Gracilibacillus sp. HCP3S3_G5_1]|uniref:VOC family protein n=1 Tax=unclassified Gracilibacillus TaxID=2625209 RepID=UPI003F89C261